HAQAIDAFRIAARDRGLHARAREMIGRCHADRGDHEDALPEFTAALAAPALDAAGEAELRFQLAHSLAEIGETSAAVQQLEIAPGIEMSSTLEGQDLHVLGYFLDWRSPALLERLGRFREERRQRALAMVQRLGALGVPVSADDVFAAAGPGVVGRPHVAH